MAWYSGMFRFFPHKHNCQHGWERKESGSVTFQQVVCWMCYTFSFASPPFLLSQPSNKPIACRPHHIQCRTHTYLAIFSRNWLRTHRCMMAQSLCLRHTSCVFGERTGTSVYFLFYLAPFLVCSRNQTGEQRNPVLTKRNSRCV